MSPDDTDCLSSLMRDINQRFVQQVNRNQRRCGSSWQGRFKSCIVDSGSYLLTCQRYIELNPVRARMVEGPWLYPWSSYLSNAMGRKSELVSPHPAYLQLGATTELRQAAYRRLFDDEFDDETLAKIRTSASGGWPMGPESFARQVANALGTRAAPGKPGRPPKEKPGQTRV